MKTFLQCQNNAFPIIFSNKVNISVKLIYFHAFFILDNFNEEKNSLTTFIRFKECGKCFKLYSRAANIWLSSHFCL